MKLIRKETTFDGHRKLYFCGIKIFKYKKKFPYCDIYNIENLLKQGTKFPHPIGIVISRATTIGNNCIIYQNVTIGARNYEEGDFNKKENYPVIGNNVIIYAGAVIAGNVKIGDNAVIGANSVVLIDVPENSIAIGVPARIKNKK